MKRTMLRQIILKDDFTPDECQNQSIVGDDGELLQADMTVYPDYYTYYQPTPVRHDAPLLRIYDNLRDNGCAYLLLAPIMLIGAVMGYGATRLRNYFR